ncbi:MAG: carbohydrate ABC transporter permease, partial [Streptosporangiaceae bacterium]
ARVDGAGPVQSFLRISLPLIRPALAVCAVEALVLSLNIFDQVYILNGIAPLGSSVMLQTYVTTFENLNFGGGYALSLLVTLATAVLSMAALALLYRRPEAA